MTFAAGVKSALFDYKYPAEDPNFPELPSTLPGESQTDSERNSSFAYPGGIVACILNQDLVMIFGRLSKIKMYMGLLVLEFYYGLIY